MIKIGQKETLLKYGADSRYYLIKKHNYDDTLLNILETKQFNFENNEIFVSLELKNDNKLFVLEFDELETNVDNQLQLLLTTLNNARIIEQVLPHVFTWAFNGLKIIGLGIIPSGNLIQHTTISRYGGTENFYKVLHQHLNNIIKIKHNKAIDYEFVTINREVPEYMLAIGSINERTNKHCVTICLKDDYKEILRNSTKCVCKGKPIKEFNMKFWAKEINPDFLVNSQRIRLKNPLPLTEEVIKMYPAPIKRLMNLKYKGNYYRFLLARFLLSVHTIADAKYMFVSVLGSEEAEHIRSGNCASQWTYIVNNYKKYDCPTMKELADFIEPNDEPLVHPLEKLEQIFGKNERQTNTR